MRRAYTRDSESEGGDEFGFLLAFKVLIREVSFVVTWKLGHNELFDLQTALELAIEARRPFFIWVA